MKVTFENPDKVNGLMTLTVEEADFNEKVEKQLKDYRKRANIPGFRPGQVPMGMVRRQYGAAVKVDVINNVLGEEIYKYVRENKIQMLGEPMPSEKQVAVDLEKEAPYTFVFDIAVAPEFSIELTDKDAVDFYNITVDDKLIDQQIEMYASRSGHYDKVEEYAANDMLKGDLRELDAEGNTKSIREWEVVVIPNTKLPEVDMVNNYLSDNGLYNDDISQFDESGVSVSISWGDWKHDHGYVRCLMGYIGYDESDEVVTEENGSDCYSAIHYFHKEAA